jgi:anti-sigma B factor antagonist
MPNCRTVVVKDLPESVTLSHIPDLCREIVPLARVDWPCLVFDFSNVREVDRAGVELLLLTMEEAVKRNGDLKLAAVPPQIAVILELTRVDRLFEMFDTPDDAVESFHSFPARAFNKSSQPNATREVEHLASDFRRS